MRRKRSLAPSFSGFQWPAILGIFFVTAAVITLSFRGVDIFGLVASATSSLARASVILYISPFDDDSLLIGDVKKIDVAMNAARPVNALGVTLKFPQDSIDVLGFSKEKSFFDLWTEESAIHEDDGEIHFSGGTTRVGGITGTGTVLTITVRAKKSGDAKIYFKDSEAYAADGEGTKLDDETRELVLHVKEPQSASHVAATSESQPAQPLPRTPDVNTDGVVNLVDVSIMVMRLMMPYDYHFDLDMDGGITVSDISIVLASMH